MVAIRKVATALLCCGACVLVLLPSSALGAQQSPPPHTAAEAPPLPHNGLWWAKKSNTWHEGFITGYKSGIIHETSHTHELTNIPASELLEGVDKFYGDFRNRNILVDEVLQYVTDELRGVPDEKLKAELLKLRAAATPTNPE